MKLKVFAGAFVVACIALVGIYLLVIRHGGSETVDTSDLQVVSAPTLAVATVPVVQATSVAPATTAAVASIALATSAIPVATTASTAPAPIVPAVTVPAVKSGVVLSPMAWEAQTWNNCAPVSVEMALSYYGYHLTQKEAAAVLKPNDGDKHVEPHQIVEYVDSLGFKAEERENGSLDLLRKFLSAGIPVITQQWLKDNDDIGHYRVARGYDTAKGIFLYNDSMDRHALTPVDNALEEKLWKAYDHRYFPVYTPQQQPLVDAILGADADGAANTARALDAAKAYAAANPGDTDAWRNLGVLDFMTGDYNAAIGVWEQHLTKMLTPSDNGPSNRFLWYQLWPIQSYNKVGNYQQVLKLLPNELNHTKVYAEARYEYAIALLNTGQRAAAVAQLRQADSDDIHFAGSRDMLAQLGVKPE